MQAGGHIQLPCVAEIQMPDTKTCLNVAADDRQRVKLSFDATAAFPCNAVFEMPDAKVPLNVACAAFTGRQRVRLSFDAIAINDMTRGLVEVLPELGHGQLPREVRAGAGHWTAPALLSFDATTLADRARTLFRHFAPEVSL